jgi:hypothetical protein
VSAPEAGDEAGDEARDARAQAAAMERKYGALVELRRRRDAGGDPMGGGGLRALATEFPGCLRELDTLGLPELERRASAAAAAAAGAPAEPWLSWIGAYHGLLRGALAVRAPARSPDAASDATALARLASAAAGLAIDETFVDAVLTPPGGRIGVVVLRALAVRFDVPAATIAAALFPARRPSPYAL